MRISKQPPQLVENSQLFQRSPEQSRTIDRLWTKSLEQYPKIFKGPVLISTESGIQNFQFQRETYDLSLAIRKTPQMFTPPLYSLSITGVIIWQEQILMGKRSQDSPVYPGCWEVFPAGTLESPNLLEQLLKEFKEETQLDEASIEELSFLAPLLDRSQSSYDFVFRIRLRTEESIVVPSTEHSEVKWVPLAETHSLASSLPEFTLNVLKLL